MRPVFSRALVSAFLGLITISGSAWAKTSVATIENQASALFQQGKYSEAFVNYQKGAKMGKPDHPRLHVCHREGHGEESCACA